MNNSLYSPSGSGQGSSTTDSDVTGANGANTTSSFTVLSGDDRRDLDAGYRFLGSAVIADEQDVNKSEVLNDLVFDLNGQTDGSRNPVSYTHLTLPTTPYV